MTNTTVGSLTERIKHFYGELGSKILVLRSQRVVESLDKA